MQLFERETVQLVQCRHTVPLHQCIYFAAEKDIDSNTSGQLTPAINHPACSDVKTS